VKCPMTFRSKMSKSSKVIRREVALSDLSIPVLGLIKNQSIYPVVNGIPGGNEGG
jgi:hypothetical protein